MKLQRFFIEEELIEGKKVSVLDVDFVHQVFHVFRKKIGDQLVLLDNSGFEFLAEITFLNKKQIDLNILDKKVVKNINKKEIVLFASLIKKDKFEWVLEKCTELGVSKFVPIISERSEKKGLNMGRVRKIIKEASEQSERGFIPTISEPINLEEALKSIDFDVFSLHFSEIIFDEDKLNKLCKLGFFVGPEGGWGERDIELFEENNISLISLGGQVLRAETASIAICAKTLL